MRKSEKASFVIFQSFAFYSMFPCQLNEAEVKIYPVAACQKIYDLIENKIKEGFKTDRAVEHVFCSKQYARIIKRDGSG